MKPNRFSLLLIYLFAGALSASAQSYMKVMDPNQINGESRNSAFINWTAISGFNGGSAVEGSDPTVTKCFTISMRQDKMAYYLKKEMYTGSSLTSVQLDFVKDVGLPSPATYYRLLMENVYVTAIEEALDDDGSIIMNVSFTPQRFRYTHWPQNPNGGLGTPVTFGWDVSTQQQW